ncbi:MAG: NAD-dependent deacylase [Bacteroidota bacterium]
MSKKKVVVLTGAGISAESGLKTFRGAGGLWEGHPVMEVASPQGFRKNPELVLRFYNERRRQLKEVEPNEGHKALVKLEEQFDVTIVTQNVDNLHERAGSSNIIHLHGMLTQKRSVLNEDLVEEEYEDIVLGDLAPDGGQWRPHIVWFGEEVPKIMEAAQVVAQADILMVVGTSLVVYPAAGLVEIAPSGTPIYVVDPNRPEGIWGVQQVTFIEEPASTGVPKVLGLLSATR